jgi:hypothetical protein
MFGFIYNILEISVGYFINRKFRFLAALTAQGERTSNDFKSVT